MMKNIDSIPIELSPFKLRKDFEAVLLFHEYPTTTIYKDLEGFPVLKEWVDCHKQEGIDRFLYFRTTAGLLKKYLKSEVSHLELLMDNVDGFVIVEDSILSKKINYKTGILSNKKIPLEYKPDPSFYFEIDDGVQVDKIESQFNLRELTQDDKEYLSTAKVISMSRKSETLLFRLKQGRGVGFGTANTGVLANSLLKFDKLFKEAALDKHLGLTRGEILLNAKRNEGLLPYVDTEVYDKIAASFGLLIRPVSLQPGFFGKTHSEEVTERVFSLIDKSQNEDDLKEEYERHSDFTIRSYKNFVEEIYNQGLNIDLDWLSPNTEKTMSDNIDYRKASKIKENIEKLTVESVNPFKVKGKFRAVNCDAGTFTFNSLNNEKYSGTFDKIVKEGSERINFIDLYEISVSRTTKKQAGKEASKIIDVINGFVLDT